MPILAVWGPPQSGKTTLSIDLAYAFSGKGRSVCLISPAPFSELSTRLDTRIEYKNSLPAALSEPGAVKQIVQKVDDLLFVLAVPFDYDAFTPDASEESVRTLLESADASFDVVLVDCPAIASSSVAAWAMNLSSSLLLLSGSSADAVMWHTAYQRYIYALQEKTIFTCVQPVNRFDYHALCKLLGKIPVTSIPYIPNIAPEPHYGSATKSGRAYSRSLDTLLVKLLPEPQSTEQDTGAQNAFPWAAIRGIRKRGAP